MADRQGTYVTRVVSVELNRFYGNYQAKEARILGLAQVILGLWSIALGIAHTLTNSFYFKETGFGIWCGVIFVIAGFLGVLSYNKTPSVIMAYMVFSIIAGVFALLQLCLAVASAHIDFIVKNKNTTYGPPPNDGTVVVDCLLAVGAIAEGVVAVVAATFGCGVTCCNNKFTAAQQEIDHPQVRSYDPNETHKYIVNPNRF